MNDSWVNDYLARIGASRPQRPDLDALRDLHLHHLRTVPFENLGIHLGEDVVLDSSALVAKIVDRRRGGFCYELNGAFGALLSALGFEVSLLAARVISDSGLGVPYDHMVLQVGPWLADVGFGDHAHYPLRIDERGDQVDPAGTFRLTSTPSGDLELSKNGKPEYLLETRPRALTDFETGCWWHRTSPKSHFTQSLVCSMLTESGRVTLSGRTLIRTVNGEKTSQDLGDDGEVLAAYRAWFGIDLDRVPEVARPPAPVGG